MPIPILVPLLNPNEPEATIVSLHIAEGQYIRKNELLATLETTKTASDLVSENEGYVAVLRLKQGDVGRAGEVFCYLAESPDWRLPEEKQEPAEEMTRIPSIPAGMRITKPAEKLACEFGLDLNQFPAGGLITEKDVRQAIQRMSSIGGNPPGGEYDRNAILVYGGGGHGKTVIDLLQAMGGYRIAGVIDDGMGAGDSIMGFPILGGSEILPKLRSDGIGMAVNAVGGIGDVTIRVQVFHKLAQAGFLCPPVIHPSAVVEPSAVLLDGVQVFAQAYVGSEAKVGFGCIVNTGAVVSHDCVLEDYVNISPGAILAGDVFVGSQTLIGMGATVNLRVRVGERARIGNGATIKQDVPDRGIVRAGNIWP